MRMAEYYTTVYCITHLYYQGLIDPVRGRGHAAVYTTKFKRSLKIDFLSNRKFEKQGSKTTETVMDIS